MLKQKFKKPMLAALLVMLGGWLIASGCDLGPKNGNAANQNNGNTSRAGLEDQGILEDSGRNLVESSCALSQKEASAADTQEQYLLQYFQAISKKDYSAAFALLDTESKNKYAKGGGNAFQNFSQNFESKVKCLQATSFEHITDINKCPSISASMGIQCYKVGLEIDKTSAWENKDPGIAASYVVTADPHADPGEAAGSIGELTF